MILITLLSFVFETFHKMIFEFAHRAFYLIKKSYQLFVGGQVWGLRGDLSFGF
jgi:hypothetical protein